MDERKKRVTVGHTCVRNNQTITVKPYKCCPYKCWNEFCMIDVVCF